MGCTIALQLKAQNVTRTSTLRLALAPLQQEFEFDRTLTQVLEFCRFWVAQSPFLSQNVTRTNTLRLALALTNYSNLHIDRPRREKIESRAESKFESEPDLVGCFQAGESWDAYVILCCKQPTKSGSDSNFDSALLSIFPCLGLSICKLL